MTRDEAQGIVGILVAAYPSATVEPETAQLYISEFEQLRSFARAARAAREVIRGSKWFPAVAEVLEVYRRLKDWEPTGALRALEQATEARPGDVQELIERISLSSVDDAFAALGALKEEPAGKCGDCKREVPVRYRLGSLALCRVDAANRLKVKARMEVASS